MKAVCPKHHAAYDVDVGCPDCGTVPKASSEERDEMDSSLVDSLFHLSIPWTDLVRHMPDEATREWMRKAYRKILDQGAKP